MARFAFLFTYALAFLYVVANAQVMLPTNNTNMDSDSKSYYHKSGNAFRVTPKVNLDLHERLPVGTYNVNYDQIGSEYFLETINDFQLKGKIYGKPTFVSKLLTVHSFLLFNYHSCIYSYFASFHHRQCGQDVIPDLEYLP